MGNSASNLCKQRKNVMEKVVCKETDMQDNSMKEFEVGPKGEKLLMVKQAGKFYAIGPKCSHYGAPLVTGALGEGRVRCPWHGACFNLATGDIEDFPGLDSVPCFEVSVTEEGDVKVKGSLDSLTNHKRVKPMASRNCKSDKCIVIVGGGAAGSSCAETLRQEGYDGRLVILTNEKHLPYDRVKVSKSLDMDVSKLTLRSDDFYKKCGIEIIQNEEVTSVNTEEKTVKTASGKSYSYTKLFIANGAKARSPSYPGSDLKNIFTVRSIDDANMISNKLTPELNVVVIGSSFIAMESAAFCASKVKKVTVIGRSPYPFQRDLVEPIGARILQLFTSKGVQMEMNATVDKFVGENGVLIGVLLADGRSVDADVCICGLGAEFSTDFLLRTPVARLPTGAIDVNEMLQTNVENVYAGGDVANAPVYCFDNRKASIGHWQLAQYHGHVAALNMCDKKTPLKAVPFFFSMLFGVGLRYVGYAAEANDNVIVGSLEDLKFVSYFLKNNTVVAVCTVGKDPIASQFAELLYNGKSLERSQIADNAWAKSDA